MRKTHPQSPEAQNHIFPQILLLRIHFRSEEGQGNGGMRDEGGLPGASSQITAPLPPSQAKDNPAESSPQLPPLSALSTCWGGGLQESFSFYGDYCNWWRRGLGVADGLPLLREWSVPMGRGRVIGEQMATPSFQCLPRWLPPPPYWCHAQDMREPPHVTGDSSHGGGQVFTALPPKGCPGEIFSFGHPR